MRFITFISLLIVVAFTACATTNSKTTHSRHDMIQLEQIREQLASDAYDLIRKLRPQWLRSRGDRSIHFNKTASYATVYVNGPVSSASQPLRSEFSDEIISV